MKKRLLFPAILLATLTLAGCEEKLEYFDEEEQKNPSLILSVNKYDLEVGESFKLNYLLFNSDEKPTFSSNDSTVATVDGEGNVKGVSIGTTNINVDLGNKHYSCEINVLAAKQYYIYINNDDVTIEVNATFEVNPVLKKTSTDIVDNATFTYKSENTSIFTVNENIVKGVSVGEANLLITAQYNSVDYYKVLTVKVI